MVDEGLQPVRVPMANVATQWRGDVGTVNLSDLEAGVHVANRAGVDPVVPAGGVSSRGAEVARLPAARSTTKTAASESGEPNAEGESEDG